MTSYHCIISFFLVKLRKHEHIYQSRIVQRLKFDASYKFAKVIFTKSHCELERNEMYHRGFYFDFRKT